MQGLGMSLSSSLCREKLEMDDDDGYDSNEDINDDNYENYYHDIDEVDNDDNDDNESQFFSHSPVSASNPPTRSILKLVGDGEDRYGWMCLSYFLLLLLLSQTSSLSSLSTVL